MPWINRIGPSKRSQFPSAGTILNGYRHKLKSHRQNSEGNVSLSMGHPRTIGTSMSLNFHSVSEQAKRHTQKGRHDKAIDLWNEFTANATDADAGNAHNIVGDLHLKKKDTVTAIDHFLKASHAFERSGYPLKAIATLKKVLKIEPEKAEVYLRLGDLNARRDMIGNAVESYLTVVRLMTRNDEQGAALELIRRVCILDPVNIRHRLQIAAEMFQLGYTRQAMDETVNAIDLFLEQGNLEEAERYCRHLLDMEQDFSPARERIEKIAIAGREGYETVAGTGESAIDDLFAELDGLMDDITPDGGEQNQSAFGDLLEPTQIVEDGPASPPDPLLGLDKPDGGSLMELDGNDNTADLRQMAFKHLDAGEFEASLDQFDRFVTESIALGEYQEADAALKAYIAIDPDNPVAHEVRLRIYQDRDREMEKQIVEQLIILWQDVDEGKASHYDQHLAALNDPFSELNQSHHEHDEVEPTALSLTPPDDSDSDDSDDELVFNIPGLSADGDGGHMMIQLDNAMLADDGPVEDASEEMDEPTDDAQILPFELNNQTEPTEAADTAFSEQVDQTEADGMDMGASHPNQQDGNDSENLFRIQLDTPDDAVTSSTLSDAVDSAAKHVAPEDLPPAEADSPFRISLDLHEPDGVTTDRGDAPDAPSPDAVTAPSFTTEESAQSAVSDLLNFQDAIFQNATDSAPDGGSESDPFDLNEALAEAAFYAHQNLTDEAVKLYREILTHHPGHSVASTRLADLGVEVPLPDTPSETPTETPMDHPSEPVAAAPSSGSASIPLGTRAITNIRDDDGEWDGNDDEFANFTSEIQNAFEQDDSGLPVSEDAQLSEILTAFRDGIKEQVSDEDSETHYDLGVAYREMGLMEEAVGEFQIAIKGVMRHADACIALAECFGNMGREHLAVGHLRRALERSDNGPNQWIALAYELASALEKTGDSKDTGEANKLYEEVYARDIGFRDVAEKVARSA